MKDTCSSARGGGSCVEFAGSKKHLVNGKELNPLVTSAVAKATKININPKVKAKDAFDSDNKVENFQL